MSDPTAETIQAEIGRLAATDASYATVVVERLLARAAELGASDVHFLPTPDGLDVRWRLDGVLNPAVVLPVSVSPKVVARLKVLADLLTYRSEIPQEGRLRYTAGAVEMRLSTVPTLHGEKAVVRMFAATGKYLGLDELGFSPDVLAALQRRLSATAGALLFTGPAGSGKTTTLYASLRGLVAQARGGRSLTTLEDPIEVAVPGVAQSQVNPGVGYTMEVGLRALLRQDPEVIAIGEIRDRGTAEVAFQASLTGHLVLSTFHAGSGAAAVGRLADMAVEPYLLRSGLLAVVAQRLVRRLCSCSRETADPALALGLNVERFRVPVGCVSCGGTGYAGRLLLAELFLPDPPEVARAILDRVDIGRLDRLACDAGMTPLLERARQAVAAGLTDPSEVRRVLGLLD